MSFTMHTHPLMRPSPALRPARARPVNQPLPLRLRLGGAAGRQGDDTEGGELAREPRLALLEAALMAADEPLTVRRLISATGLADAAEARRLIRRLQELYNLDGTAFQLVEVAGGYQLQTRPEFHGWLVRLRRSTAELRLSAAARETLTIVAYRQPITRADVEGIRGVQCGEVLRQLMEKNLIRIAGRDASLGRPVLYGTTKKFLQVFGLNSLRDLPKSEGLGPPREKDTSGGAEKTES